jgi:putative NADH-flavin reductase
MSTVLIIGASRGIGFETMKCAVKAGHRVRALARSACSIPVSHTNLEKITGDALDFRAIKQALVGINVVIQTLGVDLSPESIFRPSRLFSVATRVLVTAMEETTGVKRLICVARRSEAKSGSRMTRRFAPLHPGYQSHCQRNSQSNMPKRGRPSRGPKGGSR